MKLFGIRNFNIDVLVPAAVEIECSQFDLSQQSGLNAVYSAQGRTVLYNGDQKLVMIVDQFERWEETDGQTSALVEYIDVCIRRYGLPIAVLQKPEAGDELQLLNDAGVAEKTFRLTQAPTDAFNCNEWELRFSRTKTVERGSSRVRLYGGMR